MKEASISYSAVVLEEASRDKLLSKFAEGIPKDWEVIAHHMTITMGPLIHAKGKYDMSIQYPLGNRIALEVSRVGMDDRAMAVGVLLPEGYSTRNRFPHITIAVNREGGGKPSHSNRIEEEHFQSIEPFFLYGIVKEIPHQRTEGDNAG